MKPTNEQWLSLYEGMVRTRMAEQHLDMQYRKGRVRGMGHWSTGLEAVGVATAMSLRRDDVLFHTHRGFPELIGKGMAVYSIYAEHEGRATGCCKGKGSVHIGDARLGLWGLTGSLGMDFSLAAGVGLGFRRQGSDRIACKVFGEGAYPQADFHPAMNLAVLWKAPVVFVLCQNEWIQHTHYRTLIAVQDIYRVAAAHSLHTTLVEDGNDVVAVYDAVSDAVAWSRSGNGPAFVECKSYRVGPHFTGDPGGYQPAEDLARWKARDPIETCRQALMSAGLLAESREVEMRARIRAEVQEDFERAYADPEPDPCEVTTDVYAGLEVSPW